VETAELIEAILDLELEMFLKVPTAQPTRCQESPEGFKLMRGAAFEVWSKQTLFFYLRDLLEAQAAGRSLLTEKYARMDNLIPRVNTNPLIDEIVRIEAAWQEELHQKYPHVVGQGDTQHCGDPTGMLKFTTYLRCELETYSDETLDSYYQDLQEALEAGRNLSEEKYARVFQKLGYASLAEAEQVLARRSTG